MIPDDALVRARGNRPGLLIRDTPDAGTVRAVLANWAKLKRRANILMAVDESGSMADPVGGGDRTIRSDAAKAAANRSINLLDREDRVGLWFFSRVGKAFESKLLPSELGDGSAFRGVLDELKPDERNNTGLYVTIREAHRRMVQQFAPGQVNAVIVLTDGKNDYPEDSYSLDDLRSYLRKNGRAKPVALYFIAFGAKASGSRAALQAIVNANGVGAVRDAVDGDTVEQVLGEIFSGATIGPAGAPAR